MTDVEELSDGAPASGVEDDEAAFEAWRGDSPFVSGNKAAFVAGRQSLAASPKAQGSDVGLREALEDERAYALALQKALTGLTRQGSEFFVRHGDGFRADISACLADIQSRRQAKERQLRAALAASRTGQTGAGE